MASETRRLRLFFLVPLLLVFTATVVVLVADTLRRQQSDLAIGMVRLQTTARQLYSEFINESTEGLELAMSLIARDEVLRNALANRDRAALLARATSIFDDMESTFKITHLYFSTPDKVVLLRVHQPERHGDLIDRTTTRLAESIGTMVHGVELGPLGTFTLRLVSPWYSEDHRTLIGYVELGMEIDAIFENIRTLFGVQILLAVRKEYLDRTAWESGMRMLGRTPNWDRYPDFVVNLEPQSGFPPPLSDRLADGRFDDSTSWFDALFRPANFNVMFQPLVDVAGKRVAELVLVADVSRERDAARRLLAVVITVSAASSLVLFAFFYGLVGWVGSRIDRDEKKLEVLATHDGLTGLYNHRTFYSTLEGEVARASRYGKSAALLMLDIDHFKTVNDTFGHMAGDRILIGLARLLQQSARRIDSVCRYGGEEIAIILPETDAAAAVQGAERLRALVEKTRFDTGNARTASVTVSIGVAAMTKQASTADELVKAADAALYAAKNAGRNCVRLYEDIPGKAETASSAAT